MMNFQVQVIATCDGCGAVTDRLTPAWRAYLSDLEEEDDVAVFCPECVERKFGQADEVTG
jgi:hypothetical protein